MDTVAHHDGLFADGFTFGLHCDGVRTAGSDGAAEAAAGLKQQVLQKASWNLDRLDQQDPNLDGIYRYFCPWLIVRPQFCQQSFSVSTYGVVWLMDLDVIVFRFGREGTVGTGKGVTIYTIDSGVRMSHQEFQAWNGGHGRASYG